MTTVFIAGSRKLSWLNERIRARLDNMVKQDFRIVVGDANGADRAVQQYLAEIGYGNVTVYCSGNRCRNNIGNWPENRIEVEEHIKGRDFYTRKDLAMAQEADYGFMIWDGESAGTMNNIMELLKRNKKAVVYLSSKKEFINISDIRDAYALLDKCDKDNVETLKRKIDIGGSLTGQQHFR